MSDAEFLARLCIKFGLTSPDVLDEIEDLVALFQAYRDRGVTTDELVDEVVTVLQTLPGVV